MSACNQCFQIPCTCDMDAPAVPELHGEAARRTERGEPMNETVRRAGERAAEALARLESTFRPDRYKLTFVARYVGPDELDADIIVSADDTDAVAAVLAKHKDTKAERL